MLSSILIVCVPINCCVLFLRLDAIFLLIEQCLLNNQELVGESLIDLNLECVLFTDLFQLSLKHALTGRILSATIRFDTELLQLGLQLLVLASDLIKGTFRLNILLLRPFLIFLCTFQVFLKLLNL